MYALFIQKSLLCTIAGIAIGFFHFGGLWLSVRGAGEGKFRATIFFVGFLVRFFVTLAAMYIVSGGHWNGILFCVLGILIARRFLVAKIGPAKKTVKEKTAI